MYLQDDNYVEIGSSSGEVYIGAIKDGAVNLRYDNVKKIETTSTGIDVTGTVNAVQLDITAGTDAKIYTSNSIGEVGAGNFAIQSVNSAGSALKPLGFRAEDIRFATGPEERMRIDNSGNVLVGKLSADFGSSVGFEANSNDTVYATRSGGASLTLNRTTSDGDIALFRKDGTNVGSIGVESSDNLTIGSTTANHSGLLFGTNAVIPMQAGSGSDATQSLGNSGTRWKDAYLSGGVYLGGTGSANKLSSYEEGNWTPALNSGSLNIASAKYTKVGRLVTLNLDASVATGGGSQITNAPFTAGNTVATPIFTSVQNFNSSRTVPTIIIGGGSPTMYFRDIGDNVSWLAMPLTTGASISFSFTYMTT